MPTSVNRRSDSIYYRITLTGRLASLEKYMGSSEPMSFVVDDVLVDIEDERSKAALNAPAARAEKTQGIC